jgi:hypothetical protein
MSPEKAFIPKKDRPPSDDRGRKVAEYTLRIKYLKTDKSSGRFSITVKPLKRLPGGKLSDLTFQDLRDALGNLEFMISGQDLELDIGVFRIIKPR